MAPPPKHREVGSDPSTAPSAVGSVSHACPRGFPLRLSPSADSQARLPGLNFPTDLSSSVSPAPMSPPNAGVDLRNVRASGALGMRERAPGPAGGGLRWCPVAQRGTRCLPCGAFKDSGAPPAQPVPWPPGRGAPTASGPHVPQWPRSPGRRCESRRASPYRAGTPRVGVSAAQGHGPAADAPRLPAPGAVRGLASEGERPRDEGAAGTMEGVLYKWTNYLSGEWGRARGPVLCLSGPRAAW